MDAAPQTDIQNLATGTENLPPEEGGPADERLENWSKNEIYELLQTLKAFGSQDIAMISQNIPTKSVDQIKAAIVHYRRRALHLRRAVPQKRKVWSTKKAVCRPPVPLNSWAKFLQESLSFKDLHTETTTALRIIAEFDKIPPATHTDNIDFKNIYHTIANAMEGKAIPDNPQLVPILNKCIVDTALTSKAFMRIGALQNVVEWIDMSDKPCVLPRPTDNFELATLRHLASQRTYNPLGIPEQFLKPN